jgi:hypothetical protein
MPCALIERARMVGPSWLQVNGLLCLLRERVRVWKYLGPPADQEGRSQSRR